MKWFKHMTDMSNDVKVKRLIRRHGVAGYGLYNYILELIVRKLETESPLPDLEESSMDIASDLNMDTVKVEEVMLFCIEQGLFEQDEVTGRIVATKVYKFLQQSETRSSQIRDMISAFKSNKTPLLPEISASQTVSDKCEEQNRTEQNRREHKVAPPPKDYTLCDSIIDYLNQKADKSYRHTDNSRKHIEARLAEGFTVEECKRVIDIKVDQWKDDEKMNQYLRPLTLFAPSKFEGYLNEKTKGEMVESEFNIFHPGMLDGK